MRADKRGNEDEDNYNADSRAKFRASRATNECKRPLLVVCPHAALEGELRTENPISSMFSIDGPTMAYNHLGYCF